MARAVDPHDQLRADRLLQQRVGIADAGAAVDAQPLRLVVQGDEQQADIAVDHNVAEALEHAVAVIVGNASSEAPVTRTKPGMPPLNEQSGVALRIGGGEKEIGGALDEGLVVGGERRARQFFFQPVGNAPAVEAVLQLPVAVVIHDAHRRNPTLPSAAAL